jgi:hypothetical protein
MFIESQRPSQSKETATARPARPARLARPARPARHQSVDFGDACAFNEFHGCFRMVLGCHKERSMTVIVCDSYIRYYYNYNVYILLSLSLSVLPFWPIKLFISIHCGLSIFLQAVHSFWKSEILKKQLAETSHFICILYDQSNTWLPLLWDDSN